MPVWMFFWHTQPLEVPTPSKVLCTGGDMRVVRWAGLVSVGVFTTSPPRKKPGGSKPVTHTLQCNAAKTLRAFVSLFVCRAFSSQASQNLSRKELSDKAHRGSTPYMHLHSSRRNMRQAAANG